MNIIQRIFGVDILCGYFGEIPQEDSEHECVPLVILHNRTGSLIPGYTIKRYWDRVNVGYPTPDIGSLLGMDNPIVQIQDTIIPVLVPFPQKKFTSPRTILNLNKSTLMRQDTGVNYLSKSNTKEIDRFDFSELNNMLEYVKANGTLTLILSDMEKVHDLLSDFNHGIVDKFGHCVMYYSGNGKLNTPADNSLLFHITFMDLNTCIPIFDGNKTDGVGILCEYVNKLKNGKDYNITGRGMAVILSNDTENIITVDGTIVGEHGVPPRDLMNTMIKTSTIKQQPKEGETVFVPDTVISNGEKPVSYGYVSNAGTYAVSTSSTTTNWNNY